MAFWVSGVDSPQEIYTRTGDGRDLVVMSGTAYFNFKGTGSAWRRDDAYVVIGPFWHRLDDVAPMAALGSWSNEHTAVDAGAAVDNCRWAVYNGRILLQVALAVRDSDGWVHRFGYTATAVGIR
jgi:hypothetical protein